MSTRRHRRCLTSGTLSAIGNGAAIETEAIQDSIDACHDAEGGIVRVPAGDFQIVRISYPGHGTTDDAERTVPEDIERYPEQFFFGVLPSWGAYIRHARNVEFFDVELKVRTSDARKRIHLEDVDGFIER